MAKMGDDWMWIGIGLAAVIGAVALFKPIQQEGKAIVNASEAASEAFQAGANAFQSDVSLLDIPQDISRIISWFKTWI